jgi:hypothetical protein
MTQQYIVGEFSVLLAELQPVPSSASLSGAVGNLRHEVEFGSLSMLSRRAGEATTLADMICWAALEEGDVDGFRRCADAAITLREFAVSANLLPD